MRPTARPTTIRSTAGTLVRPILAPHLMLGSANGQLLMLSCPPAMMISARPSWIIWVARSTGLIPEEQTLLIVMEGTDSGTPARIVAWRLGTWPAPAGTTWPMKI